MNMLSEQDFKSLMILSDAESYYRLVSEITKRMLKEYKELHTEQFLTEKQVMEMIHVKSKTTISTYRNRGLLSYIVLGKRSFLYKKSGVIAFLNSREQKAFGL